MTVRILAVFAAVSLFLAGCGHTNNDAGRERDEALERLAVAEGNLASANARIAALQAELEDVKADANPGAAEQIAELTAALNTATAVAARLQADLDIVTAALAEAKAARNRAQTALEDALEDARTDAAELAHLRSVLATATSALAAARASLAAAIADKATLESAIARLQRLVAGLRNDRTVETVLIQRMTASTAPIATGFGGDVAVCAALGCPVVDGIHIDASPDAVHLPDISGFERLWPRRGIGRARRSYIEERLNDPVSYRAFGAWTEHGFFIVETSLSEQSREFTYNTYWLGDAGDTAPVTALSGSASWSGIMTGVTDGSTGDGGAFVHGEADLTVTGLAARGKASVTVAFTNIAREDNGASLADMVWRGLPLQDKSFGTDDVRFREADRGYARRASFGARAKGSLFGHVYGPNGEEVGGLFHRGNIAGAFAAKRNE